MLCRCLPGARVLAGRNDGLPLADVLMGCRGKNLPVGGKACEVFMQDGVRGRVGPRAPASVLDVLSEMLRSVRLTGAMLFLVEASTPWVSWAPQAEAFRRVVLPAAQHLISLHIVTRGGCWAGLTGAPSARLETGDLNVTAGRP